ncbi:TPA: DEAD/DEAH box helicase [Legionella pneumophila]|uniref:DEAD/DEAH box helicase n=1 Tax=Legionella pneumophila TaxID=446 RepID=A0AAN5KTB8_LEGPN|nr:DEAD/DEAH box helicase [Legionella pneumophila]
MAFKKKNLQISVPGNPAELFRELTRRQLPDVLPVQKAMMERYAEEALEETDIALQLPTGSGKTLVGLLIAEWRRRKYQEKIIYLCPTKQLVNQVSEQASSKYGITVLSFTGKAKDYPQGDVAKYKQAKSVAVTTYSSIFNSNPFFKDADVIILDDAHAAENYIAKLWSLEIDHKKHQNIFDSIAALLRPFLDEISYARLLGRHDCNTDRAWVDKISTPDFLKIIDNLTEVLIQYTPDTELRHAWSMICSNLRACHLYLSSNNILIRPIIPPTWTHSSFCNAKQRIYMSATLGEGGDLERLTGRKKIMRLPIPKGWDAQGVGRRFFIFPAYSLEYEDSQKLYMELFSKSDRALFLVPSERQSESVISKLEENISLKIFSAKDIEASKKEFLACNNAVALIANRYDGIDFPGDECRLLVIEGLPKAVNFQEQFVMNRLGAGILYNERIKTRMLQAIGRCTRSLEDYSAVVMLGEAAEHISSLNQRKYFHPLLQAELEFGVEQSMESSYEEFIDNYNIFIENGEEWEEANTQIVELRSEKHQEQYPGIATLNECVTDEIDYVSSMWNQDYQSALHYAESILGKLSSPELRGYRVLWEYLAGSAAYMIEQAGRKGLELKSKEHYSRAKKAAQGIPWISALSQYVDEKNADEENNAVVLKQIEQIESYFDSIGTLNKRKLVKKEKEIRENISSSERFEYAHELLGKHLGFDVGKREEDASPDPWWQIGNICFVFEDHAGAESDTLNANKARQVSGHPAWMRENVESCQSSNVKIIPILISSVCKAKSGAKPHLHGVSFWSLEDFREWVKEALSVINDLHTNFSQAGDLEWRKEAFEKLTRAKIDAQSLLNMFNESQCLKLLEIVK